MQLLKQTGMNWTDVFAPDKFPTGDTGKDGLIEWHGVNIGQALKARAVEHRFTQDSGDANATSQWWDIVYKYHGRPSGVFAADEHLAGMAANRGTELCQVVEQMYSGSYVWQAFGDNGIADLVERMAYNALPATLTAGTAPLSQFTFGMFCSLTNCSLGSGRHVGASISPAAKPDLGEAYGSECLCD